MPISRFRGYKFQSWLHEDEYKFMQNYAEKHLMTMSELLRFWIHDAMKKEGVYKEPSKTVKPKTGGMK